MGVRRVELSEAKEKARSEALSRRAAIADEAEKLASSQQWKATGQRFRELLDEWKALPRFDKEEEQEQWLTMFSKWSPTIRDINNASL